MTDGRATRAGLWTRMKPRAGRCDATPLAMWFWDIDRVLLLIALCLMAIGLIAVAAASPASAVRYSGDHHHIAPLYYFWRQLAWVAISLPVMRSEEHTSELQSLMRISYAVFCLKKKKKIHSTNIQ